jgi:HSP20 family protein
MAQGEWDPLKELAKVQERMNSLFDSALARKNFDAGGELGSWAPTADVYETDDRMVFCLELPGLRLEDIDLRLEGDELIVKGERRMEGEGGEQFHRVERSYGKFARRFPIPSAVERDSVEAKYDNGVLTVALAKKSGAQPGPIKVPIR